MRILIVGSTDFTAAVCRHLVDIGFPPVAILSTRSPIRISYARDGMINVREVDLSNWAVRHSVLFKRYEKAEDITDAAAETTADVLLAAGWHHLVPKRVREVFVRGCFGLHASLLPRYRGGAPLNWAILNGDAEAGLSLFELGPGVDDGALHGQVAFAVGPEDDIGDLLRKADGAARELLRSALPKIAVGATGIAQTGNLSYSLQRVPEDGAINWTAEADCILRLIRAVSRPYPGAFGRLGTEVITFWKAALPQGLPEVFGIPGQIAVLPNVPEPVVVTGKGYVLVRDATLSDGTSALDWLRARRQQRFDVL